MALQLPPRPDRPTGLVAISTLIKGDQFQWGKCAYEVDYVHQSLKPNSVELDVRNLTKGTGVGSVSVVADTLVTRIPSPDIRK